MSADMLFVFATVLVAAVLFASNRVRLDVVALSVVLAMMLSGILTPAQTLAGFGDTVVLLVAGLLVVGEMLDRTGVAQSIGVWIIQAGGQSETRLIVLIMFASALLSSVMSSTAVVAIFIPVVFKVASNTGINAARLLMPMSFAAMISGMLTLIATPPNLVVSSELASTQGYEGLSFFSFLPIGVVVLFVGVGYILLVGRRMLNHQSDDGTRVKRRSIEDLWEEFRLDERVDHLRVTSQSPLGGRTIGSVDIENQYRVRVLAMNVFSRSGGPPMIRTVRSDVEMPIGSVLLVHGASIDIDRFQQSERLEKAGESERDRRRALHEHGIGVILIHPNCRFVGKTLREADFRSKYGVQVIGIRRGKEPLADFANERLAVADTLLVAGPWKRISHLRKETHDFVLLELPSEYMEARPSHRKAPVAIAILAAMVVLSASGILPVVTAVLMAALFAVLTRCLTMEDAYRCISWSSLVLLAGMLPLATALQETGGTEFLVENIVGTLSSSGPYVMMTVLFFLTAGLSLFLSNTATAVLIAPVAIQSALAMDVSAYPYAITVLIASSAAFASPVASPVVTLVVEPGGYRFIDFVKIGLPLMFLTYLINLIVTPILFPL
ncbi:MAG: SLC13 family permease [Planctomycetota bacterium]